MSQGNRYTKSLGMQTARNPLRYCMVATLVLASACDSQNEQTLDTAAIEQSVGTEVSVKDDGVVRVGWSRDDVPVQVDGMDFPPAAGLGSWAAFKKRPDGKVMVMGDTVVFEDEISPAMDAAFEHGLEVTALHNHFTMERPPVYFMHIGGHTDNASSLAEGVRAMWDAIKQVRDERPEPADVLPDETVQPGGQFDIGKLESILGTTAQDKGDAVKFVFPRKARMHGMDFTHTMGLATWAAFTGNQDYAAVDGDFAMAANEVQPVMRALREADIHIVALHNHMLDEEPAYYFLHYWGKGNAADLAKGLRSALDHQN